MKTVAMIHADALALQLRGRSSRQIADEIMKIGRDSGYHEIKERGSHSHEGKSTIELVFRKSGTIYFDGVFWHYLKTW